MLGSQQQTAHLLYNDETPGGEVSSYRAHAKGVVVFGRSLGFWLVHSVPKFPPDPASQPYGYPDPEAEYGQSAACVSLESKAIEGCVATCLLVRSCTLTLRVLEQCQQS